MNNFHAIFYKVCVPLDQPIYRLRVATVIEDDMDEIAHRLIMDGVDGPLQQNSSVLGAGDDCYLWYIVSHMLHIIQPGHHYRRI